MKQIKISEPKVLKAFLDKTQLREIYDEGIVRELCNLCPGCGADNMPGKFEWLMGTAQAICPICKTDRTPRHYDD